MYIMSTNAEYAEMIIAKLLVEASARNQRCLERTHIHWNPYFKLLLSMNFGMRWSVLVPVNGSARNQCCLKLIIFSFKRRIKFDSVASPCWRGRQNSPAVTPVWNFLPFSDFATVNIYFQLELWHISTPPIIARAKILGFHQNCASRGPPRCSPCTPAHWTTPAWSWGSSQQVLWVGQAGEQIGGVVRVTCVPSTYLAPLPRPPRPPLHKLYMPTCLVMSNLHSCILSTQELHWGLSQHRLPKLTNNMLYHTISYDRKVT